jgi:hypothetical protein
MERDPSVQWAHVWIYGQAAQKRATLVCNIVLVILRYGIEYTGADLRMHPRDRCRRTVFVRHQRPVYSVFPSSAYASRSQGCITLSVSRRAHK